MQISSPSAPDLAAQAEDLRTRISYRLLELASALDEARASGFMVVFGLDFDEGAERFVPRHVRLSREF
jgi:hypothetical protein